MKIKREKTIPCRLGCGRMFVTPGSEAGHNRWANCQGVVKSGSDIKNSYDIGAAEGFIKKDSPPNINFSPQPPIKSSFDGDVANPLTNSQRSPPQNINPYDLSLGDESEHQEAMKQLYKDILKEEAELRLLSIRRKRESLEPVALPISMPVSMGSSSEVDILKEKLHKQEIDMLKSEMNNYFSRIDSKLSDKNTVLIETLKKSFDEFKNNGGGGKNVSDAISMRQIDLQESIYQAEREDKKDSDRNETIGNIFKQSQPLIERGIGVAEKFLSKNNNTGAVHPPGYTQEVKNKIDNWRNGVGAGDVSEPQVLELTEDEYTKFGDVIKDGIIPPDVVKNILSDRKDSEKIEDNNFLDGERIHLGNEKGGE